MNTAVTVYLGLGSNLSNPKSQIEIACQHLSNHPAITILKQAPLYQTPAWGVTEQPDFINSALSITTQLTATELLEVAKDIEYHKMGRQANKRWHQRLIDIDILLYGQQTICQKGLTIPHPHIAERWFVILPLMTLNPELPEPLNTAIKSKIQHENPPADIIKLT